MTLDDLRALRTEKKRELDRRNPEGKSRLVIIGMGTCGIAAGAKEAFDSFLTNLEAKGMDDVVVKQTGCMGLCYSEPTVEVQVPGMPNIIYGNVDADTAKRIVEEHLGEGRLVNDHIFDKPAADIIPN